MVDVGLGDWRIGKIGGLEVFRIGGWRHWLRKMVEVSSSSWLTGEVETCSGRRRLAGKQQISFTAFVDSFLCTTSPIFPHPLTFSSQITSESLCSSNGVRLCPMFLSRSFKVQTHCDHHLHLRHHIWPVLTNWLAQFCGCMPATFLTFFNTRNCGYFATFCCVGIAHRIDGIEQAVVDWTGHETCIGQVSWFGSKKRFAFFPPENSWGLDFFTVSSRGFCPQGRKPSGP